MKSKRNLVKEKRGFESLFIGCRVWTGEGSCIRDVVQIKLFSVILSGGLEISDDVFSKYWLIYE